MDDAANAGPEHGVRPPGDLNPRADAALDFRDRPLGEMTPADYDAIGFLGGLEVHQQLRTRSKLFCRCPAGRRTRRVDAEALRHMRPTLSELGEYDGTALMEFKTRKEIVYLLERGTVCTYELDDTPPFGVDPEAVEIALEMAMLCELNLVSELHVMRKQYLDGSIPTGFQRTAMVGLAGSIPFRVPELGVDRALRIRQLSLEEDSCREVSDLGHRITFRTDRLGMPLTEVVTEPDFLTPHELQAGGRLIARVARATGKVRRGAGAARQDVNVSVAGGRRIEIKGVHHQRGLPLLVHVEAFRQLNLLRVRGELHRRGVTAATFPVPANGAPWDSSPLVVDATGHLRRTGLASLRQALADGETACAVRLPGFAGILDHPTQPGVTFAQELAERVRVIACPTRRPFMTWTGSGRAHLSRRHEAGLARALGAGSEDAVVVVWAPRDDAATAAREILIRAREALEGVPAETRQAFADGTTGFERILPGPDRMYPDTDTPPLPITDATVAKVRAGMGEAPWARERRYEALGLAPAMARRLAGARRGGAAALLDRLAPAPGPVARTVAAVLEKRVPRADDVAALAERISPLVRALEAGALLPAAFRPALDALLADGAVAPDRVLARHRPAADAAAELEAAVAAVASHPDRPRGKAPDAVVRWAMGVAMGRLHGTVDPARVRERLDELAARWAHAGLEVSS